MNIIKWEKKYELIEIFLLGLSIAIASVLFSYMDFKSLTVNTIQIWDALFSGRIHEFFLVSAENLRGSPAGGNCYGVLYLIPWAIWNFPIWILNMDAASNILNPVCFLWSKLFLIFCSVLTAFYTKKMVERFTDSQKIGTLAFILTMGAGSLLISVGYSGQDEIIYLSFLLIGMYDLIGGKKKKAFILLGFAVICCNVMLIPVIALLLLYEKNIIKLLLYFVCILVPDKIVSLLCGSNDIEWLIDAGNYKMTAHYTLDTYADWFFERTVFHTGIGTVSIYVIIIVLVYLRCFFTKASTKEELEYDSLFYPTLLLVGMCLCSWLHFYRYYICIPLLVCTVLINGHKKNDDVSGVFLFTLFSYIQTYVSLKDINNFSFRYNFMNEMGIADSHLKSENIYSIVQMLFPQLEFITMSVDSCYWAVSMFLLYYIYKKRNVTFHFDLSEKKVRFAYAVFPLCLIITYLAIWGNFYETSYEIHSESALADPINSKNELYQKYEAKGTCLKYIKIRSCTWDKVYSDDVYLSIDLVDSETGKVIETETVGANSLPNNQEIKIYFDADVLPKKMYYFRFYSDSLHNKENDIYLMKSSEKNNGNGDFLTASIVETR